MKQNNTILPELLTLRDPVGIFKVHANMLKEI